MKELANGDGTQGPTTIGTLYRPRPGELDEGHRTGPEPHIAVVRTVATAYLSPILFPLPASLLSAGYRRVGEGA